MTFAAVAMLFLIACVALGSRAAWSERPRVAVILAIAMAVAQLALLRS